MSLRLLFVLSLLAVVALMAVPAFYAAGRVMHLRDIVLDLRGQAAQSALAVGRLDGSLVEVERFQRLYVATADVEYPDSIRAALTDVSAEIATLNDAGYGDLVAAAGLRVEELHATADGLETLVRHDLMDSATSYLRSEAVPLLTRARSAVPPLAAAIDARVSEQVPIARRSAARAVTATMAAIIVALAVAAALALAAARVLTRPLDRLRVAMASVAEGSFEAPEDLPYERGDEVGDLSRSFRTMAQRLTELDRLKAEFVGTASHDLKTPISIIGGYAELMQEELDGPQHERHREMLRALGEQAVMLQRRVDQLLEISRMESGRIRLGLEELNLRHFADELHRSFQPVARVRKIRIELHVHSGAPPYIVADPDIVRTDILGNLIGNALKFTPAGGVIRLAFRPDGDQIQIEVADTGPGIPQDQLVHIFDKYYQGRSNGGGSGLGLAIAKAGVEAHGGRIEVRSPPGQGARFCVTLPVRAVATSYSHVVDASYS
jgi:two-component system, NtrC family, sensor histidine kinase GlrK